MAEEVDTTPRKRGRPRKVEDHQPAVSSATTTQDTVDQLADENAAMQAQIKYQLAALIKMAEKAGINPFEGFETPPTEDTVVVHSQPEQEQPPRPSRPKPGSLLGNPSDRNVGWVPWRKDDLDPEDTVEFVPQPIPSLVFPMTDEEGRQKIRLDVQDLVCWLTVGVPNKVNKFFYNAYQDAYSTWKELEAFKRRGPNVAPWGARGPDGRPSWHYEPFALSFGLDDDGHYVTPHRPGPLSAIRQSQDEAI